LATKLLANITMRIFVAFVVTLALAGFAKADTLYTYTSDHFSFVQGVYAPGNQAILSLVLSGSFVTQVATGAQDVTAGVVRYSFTDGQQTLTQNNSSANFALPFNPDGTSRLLNPDFKTQEGWVFDITAPNGGVHAVFATDYGITTWVGAPQPSTFGFCGPINSLTLCFFDPTISTEAISNVQPTGGMPGRWTVQTVSEPSTLLLLGTGLLGMARRKWLS
jgi:PEP-CTERM motif